MNFHKQVCVKVNAYVDKKIAPVVEAISKFKNIVTEYSCEDNRLDTSIGPARAYIMFHSKDKYENWRALGEVCNKLSKAIASYPHAELFVRWKEGEPVGIFEFNTEDAYWLTMAIEELVED